MSSHSIELVVLRSHSATEDVAQFDLALPGQQFTKSTRIELVASSVSGIPVTGDVPNYPYVSVSIDKMQPHTHPTKGSKGDMVLFLTGDTTVTHYSPPRLIRDSSHPISIDQLRVRVRLPDGEMAESGVDIGGLYLVFRVWQQQ